MGLPVRQAANSAKPPHQPQQHEEGRDDSCPVNQLRQEWSHQEKADRVYPRVHFRHGTGPFCALRTSGGSRQPNGIS
jgi:hypothetical protein